MEPKPKKLLDQVRDKLRLRNYSYATEKSYVGWIRRYILFHKKRHPATMGRPEVEAFLTDLAVAGHVAPSTQNQALHALLFLYRHVLEQPIDEPVDALRARERRRLPTVLSRDEVQKVLDQLTGVYHLIALLLCGSGLRVHECLALRVKDIDFGRNEIVVRAGKGDKDRVTMLPTRCIIQLNAHLVTVKAQHDRDLARGHGRAPLPDALARKYPNASREWAWQFVFPANSLSKDPRANDGILYRYHIHESAVQKAVRAAAQAAGIVKPVTPHTFRHCFATHLLEAGEVYPELPHAPWRHRPRPRNSLAGVSRERSRRDIRTVQELLGHKACPEPVEGT